MDTRSRIDQILKEKFSAVHLEVLDESYRHAGHASAKQSGGGHFAVTIVSDFFEGKTHLERHRAVNQALSELRSEIHALALKTYSVKEWQSKK